MITSLSHEMSNTFSLAMDVYNEYGGIRKVGLNDNGIYSFTYLYGFLGLAWLAVLFFKFLRDALVIARKQNNYVYLGIWVFFIVVSPNIAAWFFNQLGVYLLMTVLALAEHEIASCVVEYDSNMRLVQIMI